ncbi:MAG: BadF/BadG/BcrA/BcrD ATPase family protein, partial [Thermoanaerobaculia bacterium]
ILLGSGADGVVIAGTGSSVILRARDGAIHQAGGHEWVACDYGSAFWIGIQGIREAYRNFEDGQSSALLNRFRELYGIEEDDKFALVKKLRDLAVGDRDMKKDIARFAQYVCALASRGDEAAQNLVKLEAEDLADVTATAARRHFDRAELLEGIRLVQCGSLLMESDFYRTSFETQLELRLLSDDAEKVKIDWERAATGAQHAIALARELVHDPSRHLDLDLFFRPVVVQP